MRKQLKLTVEIGDANYVKPGQYFATINDKGEITSLKRREDNLELKEIAETPLALEDNKEVTVKSLSNGKAVISPSSGKDAMKKVTVTPALEAKSVSLNIADLTDGQVYSPTLGSEKIGFSAVTITFVGTAETTETQG